jgi:hypothetical protein
MKPRHAIMTAALVASAALVVFGDNEPDVAIVESVERTAPAAAPAVSTDKAAPPAAAGGPVVMRLIPRDELLGGAGPDEGGAFHTQNWNPPPPEQAPPPPPPKPTAPAIPFVFIGKTLGEGKMDIHLSQGDRIHTVHAGDVIDGVWRIDAVAPPVLTITYLPLNQVQTMNIGASQ